jgi:hypothetical protein
MVLLKCLNISRNSIGADGARAVADALAMGWCSALTELDLSANDIGREGADCIFQALRVASGAFVNSLGAKRVVAQGVVAQGVVEQGMLMKKVPPLPLGADTVENGSGATDAISADCGTVENGSGATDAISADCGT